MKKLIKFKKLIFILLNILLLTSCSNVKPKPSKSEITPIEYISTIDTSSLTSQLKEETDNLLKYNIILIGEGHGTVGNFVTELELIKCFYKYQDISNILFEIGYAAGELLNTYIQTGDETILDNFFSDLRNTTAYSKECKHFWTSLYEFNQTLPKDKKIRLYGVDIEHQYNVGLSYLVSLLPITEAPLEISGVVEQLNLTPEKFSNIKTTVDNTLASMEEHFNTYQNYLGENYDDFLTALENINQGITFYDEESDKYDDGNYREECLTNNIVARYEDTQEKCIGIFGYAHASLSDSDHADTTLAKELVSKYGREHGGVASIIFSYDNSYWMDYGGASYKIYNPLTKSFVQQTDKDLTLFSFHKDDESILNRALYENFQYIILIKNSPATTFLD